MRIRVLALLLLIVPGCKPGASGAPEALIWARGDDSGTLDPAAIEWGEDAKVSQNIFEPLVTFKTDSSELEGRLAKTWTLSPDGRTLTFDLRDQIKFHDGTSFEADDVVFTFERILDANHPNKPASSTYAPNFREVIESARAVGPRKVVFTLKKPSGVILFLLTLFTVGIVSPESVRKHGDKWPENPVGTGPYRLARWERKVKIVMERFVDYWGPKPPIARVIVVPVQKPQTAIQRLKSGEVHVVDHPTLADIKPLQADADTRVDTETSLNVCYLGFNVKKHPYSDLNFRRAVSLALNRITLNELAYYGLAEPATNIVPPAIWRGAATPPYEHDLEKAKELLRQVKLESNQVELIHMTYARPYVPEPQRVAEWVKDQLRKIGLDVRLTGYDKAAYTVKTKESDHPMFLLGWNADYPHADNFFFPLLHGKSAGDLNSSFFDDAGFNDAVERAQSEPDDARQQELYAKAYARYRELLPTVPLVHVKQVIAFSRKVSYNMHPIEYRFYEARFVE